MVGRGNQNNISIYFMDRSGQYRDAILIQAEGNLFFLLKNKKYILVI